MLEINMTEKTNLKFRLRKIAETKCYLLHEKIHNDFVSEKYMKIGKDLNYVET